MIKEVALLFALKAFEIEVLNRTDMYKWSDSCPRWLQDVMNTFLDEYDNSKFEIYALLKEFNDVNSYDELRSHLHLSKWFLDAWGEL